MRTLVVLFLLSCAALAQNTAPVGKFPSINVQLTVGAPTRPVPGSFYRKSMTFQPKLTIEGARMLAIPAAQATVLIVTMDTRAKYVQNREVYSVYSSETIDIPEVKTGERRQFEFTSGTTTYDAYRDNSNVGGEVYKYYIFGLRDPQTKALIDFKTNNPALLTLCKSHPDKRDEFLGMAKGAKFPDTFK